VTEIRSSFDEKFTDGAEPAYRRPWISERPAQNNSRIGSVLPRVRGRILVEGWSIGCIGVQDGLAEAAQGGPTRDYGWAYPEEDR
jgi:hypothetical protein